jgi:hypothetical protein
MRGCHRDTPTRRTMNLNCLIVVIAPHASPADARVRYLGELADNPTFREIRYAISEELVPNSGKSYFSFAASTLRTRSVLGPPPCISP